MTKNCLFAVALVSVALWTGCAKGLGSTPSVTVSNGNLAVIFLTQTVQFTAQVTNTNNTAVNWSVSGSACTGSGNPCGTIDASGLFTAPATAPSSPVVTITATSQADSSGRGQLQINLVPITVVVTPASPTVGQGLVQQFTAVAVPDDAPQTFTWTCTPAGSCGTVVQDPNVSGLAVYTAPSSTGNVVVAATSTVPQSPAGVGQAKITVGPRLSSGTYAFQFSGHDNSGNRVAMAGSFILAKDGITITAGVEDVLSANVPQQFPIASVKYVAQNTNNNLGTLTLTLTGGPTNTYTAALTSSGIMRMIESDGLGTGSGVLQKSAASTIFNAAAQTFAFGFTGVDATGNRVGYVGLLPLDGNGNITGGLLDSNDNGTNVCGAQPCNVSGTYSQPNPNLPTLWHMTLTSGTTLNVDFFVSAGQTSNAPNPLTLYAISTGPSDATHVSGTMVFQFPMTYNNAAFSGSSVSNLTGENANVSLTVGTTDGASGGTGGTGGFTGTFDQNNNGTILSVPATAPFTYQYGATAGNLGRYTFQMLGNPTANPVVAPLPFVLYASGANRGFLLDQSSSAVMAGTMDPQTASAFFAPTELPGTYAGATISNADSSLAPTVENLLLTSPGGSPAVFNVAGIQNPGNITLTGAYTMTTSGTGTITLTAPAAATFAIYAIDVTAPKSADSVITDFMMIGTTSGTPSTVVFAQQ
jgi:hypothetical protein